MTTLADRPARSLRARRGAVVGLATGAALALLAPVAPAAADVPEGWSNPDEVGAGPFLLVLVGAPFALALLIALAVYVPALVRGEKVTPGPVQVEDQWFGGPRPGARELAGPDDETSQAGGAGARW